MRRHTKIWVLYTLVGALFFASPALAQRAGALARSVNSGQWAVLIGIVQYEDRNAFADLQYSENDVLALRDCLIECGFSRDHVVVMTDSVSDPHLRPTKQNIEAQLTRVLERSVREGDNVIVTFSGHGQNRDGASYLCPLDASPAAPVATMISFDQLYVSLAQSRATLKLAIIDACRNEVVTTDQSRKLSLFHGLQHATVAATGLPQGLMIWASCLDHEVSIEDEVLKHGIFMNFVIEGLSGKADFSVAGNHDGLVSPYELFAFASMHTTFHAQKNFASRQQPWFKGEFTANLQLARLSEAQREQAAQSKNELDFLQPPEVLHAQDEYAKAVQAFQNGDLESVIVLCSNAIEYDADPKTNRAAYRMRAVAYRLKGDLRNAVADLQKIGERTQVRVASPSAALLAGSEQQGTLSRGDLVEITNVNVTKTPSGEEQVWFWVASAKRTNTVGAPTSNELKGWVAAEKLQMQGGREEVDQIARHFQQENQLPVSGSNTFSRYASRDGGPQNEAEAIGRAMDTYDTYARPFGAPSIPYGGYIRAGLGLFGN